MTRLLTVAAVVTLAALPLHADAESYTIGLRKIDLTTEAGMTRARFAVAEVADSICGPIAMPQPLALRSSRLTCHSSVTREAMAAVETARKRQLAQLTPAPLASR